MKKNLNVITMFLLTLVLTTIGCVSFEDDPTKSVWSDFMWVLPWLTGIGAAIFGYQAYTYSKSGSRIYKDGKVVDENAGNMPIYSFGQFWFSVGLIIATIFIIWNTVSNR